MNAAIQFMNVSKSSKYRCLIIDDDPMITDLIQHFCGKHPLIDSCLSCNNAVDGLKLISAQNFDIVFLDYNMPDLTGKAILELKQDGSAVIMITSHSDFAVESYNYPEIIDYLLKPVKYERFEQAIKKYEGLRAQKESESRDNYFYVKDGNKWVKIDLNQIYYVKSESNYVGWHFEDRQLLSLMKLKDLEGELPPNFLRVHRSYIVNKHKIEELTRDMILIKGKTIPVGKSYRLSVENIISNN